MNASRAARQFVVIDSSLRCVTGHEYEYTKLVLEGATEMGYRVRAWGGNDAAATIRAEPWFVPAFSEPGVYKADVTGRGRLILAGLRWIGREIRWYRELRRVLTQSQLVPGDIVFIHTIHNPSIWQWWFVQDWFEKRDVYLFLFFRVARNTIPRGLRRFFDFCYRRIGVGRSHIHFLTDTDGLRKEYERVSTSKPLTIVGLPVDPAFYEEPYDLATPARPIVASIGNARSDKGFHLFPEIIRFLNERPGGFEGTFRIQCTPPQGGLDRLCQAAFEELKELRNSWNNVELTEEELTLPAYRQMLRDCSVFVFPYEVERYRTATSNVLGQVLTLGKSCVVTADTWLAESVSLMGLGEICERSPTAFAVGIAQCVSNLRTGTRMLPGNVAFWRSLHSPQAIVREIERLATGLPSHRTAPARLGLATTDRMDQQ